MSDDKKFEDLLYMIGEEKTIRQADSAPDVHNMTKFQRRMNSKKLLRRTIVITAATVAVLGITASAYAVNRYFNINSVINEETGELTTTVDTDIPVSTEHRTVNKIKAVPGYIPDGYVESNTPGKYQLKDETSESGISIFTSYGLLERTEDGVTNVENTELGGVKAQIVTCDGMPYNHRIKLYYYDTDQCTTELYFTEDIPYDEVIKVAENMKYEVIPDEYIELMGDDEIAENEKASNNSLEDLHAKLKECRTLTDSNVIGLNQEVTMSDSHIPNIAINNVEVLDSLPNLDRSNFYNYDEYLNSINSDGTLKRHNRILETGWKDSESKTSADDIGQKFVSVKLTMTNPQDKDLINAFICPKLSYTNINGNDENYADEHSGGKDLPIQCESEPFYFDQSDYADNGNNCHFYFCDLAAQQSEEVQLIYAVDEDLIDNAYITLNQNGSMTGDFKFVKLTSNPARTSNINK